MLSLSRYDVEIASAEIVSAALVEVSHPALSAHYRLIDSEWRRLKRVISLLTHVIRDRRHIDETAMDFVRKFSTYRLYHVLDHGNVHRRPLSRLRRNRGVRIVTHVAAT